MTITKYIEIDSTYRNRNQYPNPADFIVFLPESIGRNCISSDPISLAAPQKIWVPSDISTYIGSVYGNGANNLTRFIVSFPNNLMSKENDYYNGFSVMINTTLSTITQWNFLSTDGVSDYFNIGVLPLSGITLSDIKTGGQTFTFIDSTDLSIGVFFIPNGISINNYYNNYIIYNQTIKKYRRIISYDGNTKLAGIDMCEGPLTGWNLPDTYVLRNEPPIETGTLEIVSQRSVKLPPSTLGTECYVGSFLRIASGLDNNKIYIITSYNKNPTIPLVATIQTNLSSSIGDTCTYEILQFTKSNEMPYVYNGTTIGQQELTCYEICLVDLVLPNKLLVTGGRTISYPYVYVELQNVSSSCGNSNMLYSNNPNSIRKMFRCPMNCNIGCQTPFLKIDCHNIKQTVKFKPNDNLHFAVYLPNGKLFQTVCEDNYSPESPNPLLQISALFSIKKV